MCQIFCGFLFRGSSLAVSVTLQSVAFLNITQKISSESPFAYGLLNCSLLGRMNEIIRWCSLKTGYEANEIGSIIALKYLQTCIAFSVSFG